MRYRILFLVMLVAAGPTALPAAGEPYPGDPATAYDQDGPTPSDSAEAVETPNDSEAAQEPVAEPQVNKAEILRMGDMVQHIDGLHRATAEDAYVAAMGPPESDADKWFISVISMRSCAACQKLKRDWRTSPWLLALARPDDPDNSWAHHNVYWRGDESQMWRFEDITIAAYPTILVQPPRSGRFGKPETVVFQSAGYGGDPQKLASRITRAIRLYIAKLPGQPPSAWREAIAGDDTKDKTLVGVDPPWIPAPLDEDNVRPLLPIPDGGPLIPPILDEPRPLFEIPWGRIALAIAALFGIPPAVIAACWLIYRRFRKANDKKTLLDEQLIESLLERFRQESQPARRKTATRSTRTKRSKKAT